MMRQSILARDTRTGRILLEAQDEEADDQGSEQDQEGDYTGDLGAGTKYTSTNLIKGEPVQLPSIVFSCETIADVSAQLTALTSASPREQSFYISMDPRDALKMSQTVGLPMTLVSANDIGGLADSAKSLMAQRHPSKLQALIEPPPSGSQPGCTSRIMEPSEEISDAELQLQPQCTHSYMTHSKRIMKRKIVETKKEQTEQQLKQIANTLLNQQHLTQKQVAARLKVTQYRIQVWCHQSLRRKQKQKKKYRIMLNRQNLHQRAKQEIQHIVARSTEPISSSFIVNHLKTKIKLRVSKWSVIKYLKYDLGMVYKRLRKVGSNHDILKSLLQRQHAAKQYIEMLSKMKNIVNIDETTLNQTDSRCYGWTLINQNNFYSDNARLARINMIAATTSRGQMYFTINQGKTNSITFAYFISKLLAQISKDTPKWREDTVFLLDNASYHRSRYTSEFLQRMAVPHCFLGPYQFKMAPIENLFAFIKNRNINLLRNRFQSGQQSTLVIALVDTQKHLLENYAFKFLDQTIHGSSRTSLLL